MQSYVLAAIFSALAALGSGFVMWLVTMSAKDRDRRLEKIEEALNDLIRHVSIQNGRVGKMEEWKEMREKIHPSHVMLEPKDETGPMKTRPRRRRK